jgi:hypothetical protein
VCTPVITTARLSTSFSVVASLAARVRVPSEGSSGKKEQRRPHAQTPCSSGADTYLRAARAASVGVVRLGEGASGMVVVVAWGVRGGMRMARGAGRGLGGVRGCNGGACEPQPSLSAANHKDGVLRGGWAWRGA